jgi:hypothetical protein
MTGQLFNVTQACVLITAFSGQLDAESFWAYEDRCKQFEA